MGILLATASVVGWQAIRIRRSDTLPKTSAPEEKAAKQQGGDIVAPAIQWLLFARGGQFTGIDVERRRTQVLSASPAARVSLETILRSGEPLERLLAFSFLLELDGWSPRLNERALADSFVLIRVRAADWLYLSRRFKEWDAFLAAAANNATTDYSKLMPAVQHLIWPALPAALESLGVGNGIDRYFQELIRRSDDAAAVAIRDLTAGAITERDQLGLLGLLHDSNRPDYVAVLRTMLAHAAEDTPARYEAIWLLGQTAPTAAGRDVLMQHLAANPADPLRSRVEQTLGAVNEQLALGRDRRAWLEAELAVSLKAKSPEFGPAVITGLHEAIRRSWGLDREILQDVRRALPPAGNDYAARRRLADLDFLISRNQ